MRLPSFIKEAFVGTRGLSKTLYGRGSLLKAASRALERVEEFSLGELIAKITHALPSTYRRPGYIVLRFNNCHNPNIETYNLKVGQTSKVPPVS